MRFSHRLALTLILVLAAGWVLVEAMGRYTTYVSGLEVLTVKDRADLHFYYGCDAGHKMLGKFTVGDKNTKQGIKLLLYRARQFHKQPMGVDCPHIFAP